MLVSYGVVIKGLLPDLAQLVLRVALPMSPAPGAGTCLVAVALTCLVPLSAMESMDQLRYASIASVVLVYVFVGCVCVAGIQTLRERGQASAFTHPAEGWSRGDAYDWLRCVPVVGFSYLCHMNVPTFYGELRRQSPHGPRSASPRRLLFAGAVPVTPDGSSSSSAAAASTSAVPASATPLGSRWRTKRDKFQFATRCAMLVAVVLYLATAAGGYAAFGVRSKPNVLQNLQPGPEMPLPDSMVVFLHAAFVGTMITTFPTISHGLRQSIHALLYPGAKPETARDRWLEAAGLVAAVVLVAGSIDDLGLVFQVCGSTCGSLLTFIFPACFRLFGHGEVGGAGDKEGGASGNNGCGGDALVLKGSRGCEALSWAAELVIAWLALLLGLTVAIAGSMQAVGWIG